YEHHAVRASDIRRSRRLTRSLRQILWVTRLRPSGRVLEIGCGGGAQLVPLALRGYQCTGIDCSSAVLSRLRNYSQEVSRLSGQPMTLSTVAAIFPHVERDKGTFDLVYG